MNYTFGFREALTSHRGLFQRPVPQEAPNRLQKKHAVSTDRRVAKDVRNGRLASA